MEEQLLPKDLMFRWSDHCCDKCAYCKRHTGLYASTYRSNLVVMRCPYCNRDNISGYNGNMLFVWFKIQEHDANSTTE